MADRRVGLRAARPDPGDEVVLTVLGCDGSWPGPGGAGSGYLVRVGGTCLLVDAGPGTFAVLQTLLDPGEVDAVVVSHHHADHWTDLYAVETQARFGGRRVPLPVYAPVEVCARGRGRADPDARLADRGGRRPGRDRRGLVRLPPDRPRRGDAGRTDRRRWTRPRLLCRHGTGMVAGPLGNGLDLLLCEATYTAEHEGTAGHLSGRQAGAAARAAGARRLVITHRWPTVDAAAVADEATAAFGGPVEQAIMGKDYTL